MGLLAEVFAVAIAGALSALVVVMMMRPRWFSTPAEKEFERIFKIGAQGDQPHEAVRLDTHFSTNRVLRALVIAVACVPISVLAAAGISVSQPRAVTNAQLTDAQLEQFQESTLEALDRLALDRGVSEQEWSALVQGLNEIASIEQDRLNEISIQLERLIAAIESSGSEGADIEALAEIIAKASEPKGVPIFAQILFSVSIGCAFIITLLKVSDNKISKESGERGNDVSETSNENINDYINNKNNIYNIGYFLAGLGVLVSIIQAIISILIGNQSSVDFNTLSLEIGKLAREARPISQEFFELNSYLSAPEYGPDHPQAYRRAVFRVRFRNGQPETMPSEEDSDPDFGLVEADIALARDLVGAIVRCAGQEHPIELTVFGFASAEEFPGAATRSNQRNLRLANERAQAMRRFIQNELGQQRPSAIDWVTVNADNWQSYYQMVANLPLNDVDQNGDPMSEAAIFSRSALVRFDDFGRCDLQAAR